MTNWAKENLASSGLKERPVRFLVDDVIKFVKREIRRGNKLTSKAVFEYYDKLEETINMIVL